MIEPITIISLSILTVIGHYSIFTYLFEKGFLSRFKKFNEQLESSMKTFIETFYKGIESKMAEKAKPEEFVKFVRSWSEKQEQFKSLKSSYDRLDKIAKAIYFLFLFVLILSFFAVALPDHAVIKLTNEKTGEKIPIHFLELANFLFYIATLSVIYYIIEHHTINMRLAKFELGVPIEEIISRAAK